MARQKTPTEIAAIEEAQRATNAAMNEVIEYLRATDVPTSEEAHAIIDKVMAEHDCESPEGHIVASGEQAIEPHERGHGKIARGEAIVIDIFPRSKKTGYFADMTRTVCIGKPNKPEIQRMFDAVVAAQELVESLVRPGVPCKSLQDAAERLFAERGYLTSGKGKEFTFAEGFVHAVGHGVGLEIHEKPHIGRKTEDILEEDDVITIEPGLYYKNLGGIRMEDMVLVTKNGCRNLTKFPKNFVI
jgi:Xaa-Pro aminopeptidase